jgi:hypothetical protein
MLEKQKSFLKMVMVVGAMVCLLQLYLAQNFNLNLVRQGASIISNYGEKIEHIRARALLIRCN